MARLFAYRSYRDAPAVLGWLTALGFEVVRRQDDDDGCHERAVAAGGRSVFGPEDTEWGTRRARVLDPEGGEWSFGTYEPGAAW
jgi:hypothetical protein